MAHFRQPVLIKFIYVKIFIKNSYFFLHKLVNFGEILHMNLEIFSECYKHVLDSVISVEMLHFQISIGYGF